MYKTSETESPKRHLDNDTEPIFFELIIKHFADGEQLNCPQEKGPEGSSNAYTVLNSQKINNNQILL